MDDFKKIVKEKLGDTHVRDQQSKSNQIYYLRESLIDSVMKYAQANGFTEQHFEVAFDDSLSILDGLFSAFEPYRQSTGDCGDFWEHQYINPSKYIADVYSRQKVVGSANGLLDDYVKMYIQQPAMHSRHLTCLLLDVYFYNDTISLLDSVKEDWAQRNLIYPTKAYLVTRSVLQLARIAIVIFIGVVIHNNASELLTPYVLAYLYWRYKVTSGESAKNLVKEVFTYSLENYTHSTRMYQYEQVSTVLRNSHEKYGIRYSATIYELVELLKQPW